MKDTATLSRADQATPATLLWCVMALLVPRATLFGELSPFGVGLAACGGAANLPTLLCLAVGYLLAQPLHPMRYVLTVAAVGAVRWVLAVLPEWGHRRFIPPLLAFVCCSGTGLWMLTRSGADPYRVLLIVAESCVAAGAALFLDAGVTSLSRREEGGGDRTAVTLTVAVVVMAASTAVVGGFAPGRAVAAFLVLLSARVGRESGGSIAGCVLGGAMALATPGQAPLAVALAVGGLAAGLFAHLGRWCQSALFLLTAGVVTLCETDEAMVFYITEIAAAGVLFALLPQEWERRLSRHLLPTKNLPAMDGMRRLAAMRLRMGAEALTEVAGVMADASRRLRRHGGDPRRGGLEPLTDAGDLLMGLAHQMEQSEPMDTDLSQRVAALCGDYGIEVADTLCLRDADGRLTVDILAAPGGAPGPRWRRQMERLCGRSFAPPIVVGWGHRRRITLTEPPRYRVESGVCCLCCEGERLCGDAAQVCPLGDRVLVLLSDGMGCGGQAAVDSAMTAGIAARLWTAGFSPAAVMHTANAALMTADSEERLATLDALVIHTHTGRMDSYKAGAAVTLLRSQGRVSRLDRPGLPLGILSAVQYEHSHDLLSHGDILLMLSDGALAGGVAAVEELLRDYPADGGMEELARAVCAAARQEEDHGDDITAVALRVTRAADFS